MSGPPRIAPTLAAYTTLLSHRVPEMSNPGRLIPTAFQPFMTAASAPAAEGAQPAQGAAQVDDATLQKAAKAYVKVKQIVHQSKQAAAGGAQPDQSASQSEKIAAVKNAGLEPQQYDQVIQMVQNDPGLQQKFVNYVNQNGGDSD